MIKNFLTRKTLLDNCDKRTFVVTKFDMLYDYNNYLKNFQQKWPKIELLMTLKEFTENSFEIIKSEYGVLFILSYKTPENGNDEQKNKEFNNFKKFIGEIDLLKGDYIYRLDLVSFTWLMNKTQTIEFISILNNSKKKFEVYY